MNARLSAPISWAISSTLWLEASSLLRSGVSIP